MMKRRVCFIICVIISFFAGNVLAATMCVDPGGSGTYTNLQDALDAGETNNESDTIKVVQGTYSGNFTYDSDQGYTVILQGGYVTGTTCSGRVIDPANTILDAGESGRVLYINNSDGGSVWVAGFTIQNGDTSEDGGGVYANSESGETAGDVVIATNIVQNNSSGGYGGGVYAQSHSTPGAAGNVSLANNIIITNTTTSTSQGGGGVYAYSGSGWGMGGDVTLIGNTIAKNTSELGFGGGVRAECAGALPTGSAGTLTFDSNTITENSGSGDGGGSWAKCWGYVGTGGVIFTNNIIADNENNSGAGAYIRAENSPGGNIVVTNNTIYGNSSNQNGRGIRVDHGENTVECYNNIIKENVAGSGGEADIYLDGTGNAYGYNNNYQYLSGAWTLSGFNIDEDPLLTSDYHLKPKSPCIDAGNNSAPELPATDFEGDDRNIDGDKNGVAAVDMGADEYTLRGMIAPLLLLMLN